MAYLISKKKPVSFDNKYMVSYIIEPFIGVTPVYNGMMM